jgi:hypothetical protein
MTERLSRRRRRRRLWALIAVLVVAAALVAYLVLRAQGCFAPPLQVTVTVHNGGSTPLDSLSLDQVDGAGHAVVPRVAAGATVTVQVAADDKFRESRLDLVDDATGRNYALPPYHFKGSLHGTIAVDVSRAGPGAGLEGRVRSHTDSGTDPSGWQPLRVD